MSSTERLRRIHLLLLPILFNSTAEQRGTARFPFWELIVPGSLFFGSQFCACRKMKRSEAWSMLTSNSYGPAPKNSDSAINILLDVVQDRSGKKYNMDHYATRYPTNTIDIANFLVRLTGKCFMYTSHFFRNGLSTSVSALKTPIPPILHYSGDEPFTKYEICLTFAKILGLPHDHIIPNAEAPSAADATTRPRDCHLYTRETEDLGVEGGLGLSLFEEWWTEYLKA